MDFVPGMGRASRAGFGLVSFPGRDIPLPQPPARIQPHTSGELSHVRCGVGHRGAVDGCSSPADYGLE